MGPKASKIVAAAAANPDWTQQQVAEACGSTRGAVKVVLARARKAGLVARRPLDAGRIGRGAGDLRWIPAERLGDYHLLRGKVGASEARRLIREEMARERSDELAH